MSNLFHVPLIRHTTRLDHTILRVPNGFEYDEMALLKANTLLAFFQKYSYLSLIDMEIANCYVLSLGFPNNVNMLNVIDDMERFVHLCLEMEKEPTVSAVMATRPFKQRHEQPGYAIIREDSIDLFLDTYLRSARKWLDDNKSVEMQMLKLWNKHLEKTA